MKIINKMEIPQLIIGLGTSPRIFLTFPERISILSCDDFSVIIDLYDGFYCGLDDFDAGSRSQFKLILHKIEIYTFAFYQIIMCPHFCYFTILHDDDVVGILDG